MWEEVILFGNKIEGNYVVDVFRTVSPRSSSLPSFGHEISKRMVITKARCAYYLNKCTQFTQNNTFSSNMAKSKF